MDNLWYLVVAYGAIWLAVFGYVFGLFRQGRALQDEMRFLRQMLEREQPEEEVGVAAGQARLGDEGRGTIA